MKRETITTLCLAVAILLAACSSDRVGSSADSAASSSASSSTTQDPTAVAAPSALEENRTLWSSDGSTSYQLTYTSTCGENSWISFDPVTVQVRDQNITMIEGPDFEIELATVAKLFGVIEEAESGSADSVSVTYGPQGQPMEIDIDFDVGAIDDEFCLSVSAFALQ